MAVQFHDCRYALAPKRVVTAAAVNASPLLLPQHTLLSLCACSQTAALGSLFQILTFID